MKRRGEETVTVIRNGTPNRFGEATEVLEFDVTGCSVVPDNSGMEIQTFQQDVITVDFTVIAPTGSDIQPADKLVVRTVTYNVEGQPFDLKSPITGRSAGLQVRLGAISG